MSDVTLVVGATGGIGRALCTRLAARGHRLVVVARQEGPLRELAESLGATAVVADATAAGGLDGAVREALAAYGRLDHAVSLTGSILLKPAHRTTDADWRATMSVNLDAAFHLLRAAVGTMSEAGRGSVVLMSSAAASAGLPNHEAIAAAKAGVEGLTRSAAATYAARGVRVNAVAPGLVDTPLAAAIVRSAPSLEASRKLHALGRIGQPDDVAMVIELLLVNAWITGQVITVDGGLSLQATAR